jgi:aspartyl-tRNA synthetase
MKRTHHCSQLRKSDAGSAATLIGWVDSVRDHGGILFVDLRDREGLTQIVLDPANAALEAQFSSIKPESVIEVTGSVQERIEAAVNLNLATGEIELHASELMVHNVSKTPPFPMDDTADKTSEDLRMTYRYWICAAASNLNLLRLRHKTSQAIRNYMDEETFIEVETPMLFKSTPEGAREFLVPSRMNPGAFYALPQSPQQYKQMLMVAGVERYYQLARCFRDEDLRADRQPEFTQLDIELSFIDREDMYSLIEGLMKRIWKDTLGKDIETPFLRMSYYDAMNRFGVDKPDMRFDMELQDCADIFANSSLRSLKAHSILVVRLKPLTPKDSPISLKVSSVVSRILLNHSVQRGSHLLNPLVANGSPQSSSSSLTKKRRPLKSNFKSKTATSSFSRRPSGSVLVRSSGACAWKRRNS